jgi:hypothetical protein
MSGKQLSTRRRLLIIKLIVLLLTIGLYTESRAADSGEFNGSWVANGSRENFPFSDDREVYTFKLAGHVSLETKLGKKKHYWSECVGLSDTASGAVARCVWKDLDGPEIYVTLQSDRLQSDQRVTGTIVGGSEHLEGISGDLSFAWSSISFQKEGGKSMVSGQTLDLSGSYQIP